MDEVSTEGLLRGLRAAAGSSAMASTIASPYFPSGERPTLDPHSHAWKEAHGMAAPTAPDLTKLCRLTDFERSKVAVSKRFVSMPCQLGLAFMLAFLWLSSSRSLDHFLRRKLFPHSADVPRRPPRRHVCRL